MFLVYIIWPS